MMSRASRSNHARRLAITRTPCIALKCKEACNHKNSNHEKQGLQVDICLLLLTQRCLSVDTVGMSHMPAMKSMPMAIAIVEPSWLRISSSIGESMDLEAKHREQASKSS